MCPPDFPHPLAASRTRRKTHACGATSAALQEEEALRAVSTCMVCRHTTVIALSADLAVPRGRTAKHRHGLGRAFVADRAAGASPSEWNFHSPFIDQRWGAKNRRPNRPGSQVRQYSRRDRATSIPNGSDRCRPMVDCDAAEEPFRFAFPRRGQLPHRNHQAQTTEALRFR